MNEIAGMVTTHVGEQEFTLERLLDAPRELAFMAFTRPEHLSQWWAPHCYTIPVCNIDLRPGGIWHYCMRSPEGTLHWSRAVYREIVQPERIVYTATFADEHANPIDGIPEHEATVTFTPHEDKTLLRITIRLASKEELQATMNMRMVEGLTAALNQLTAQLKEMSQS